MKRTLKAEDLAKLSVADATIIWKAQSEGIDYRHPAFPYIWQPQFNANAKNYLPAALAVLHSHNDSTDGSKVAESAIVAASDIILIAIFEEDVESVANVARAVFLNGHHGIDLEKALTSTTSQLGLDRNSAKAANNVAEAVRRMLRFFRLWLTTCPSVLIKSNWPAVPKESRRSKSSCMMGRIRKEMFARGVMDPKDATPQMIADALKSYTQKAHSTGDARHWNSSLSALRMAVAAGHYPGVTEYHLSELKEIRPNPRNPARTISEAELVKAWPEQFPPKPGDPTHLDMEKGMPGFFNKELGSKAPPNPNGEQCPPKHQLHTKAHKNRFRAARRYIERKLEKTGQPGQVLSLRDAYSPDSIKQWLIDEIDEKGKVLHSHKDGYMHALMISKHYFGYDVEELVNWTKQNIQFVKDWESTRAEKALRNGSPQTLVEQAEAMGLYAESAHRLSEKTSGSICDHQGAGRYLVRKAGQVDCWLRILTGLRPAALDALEVAASPDRAGTSPKIWRAQAGYYVVFIPIRWMKQHLVKIWGKNQADLLTLSTDQEVKGFEFEIHRQEAVSALNDYFDHGWSYAKAVVEKRTLKLYLNSKGEPCDGEDFPKAFQSLRTEVYHFMVKRHGRETQRHDRYQVRHIMSTFIETHMPGHNLKKTYLTHSADFGSDRLYGKTNMTLLREVIDEVLDGLPPRLQQQEARERERDQQLQELQNRVAELTKVLSETRNTQIPPNAS